MKKLLIIAAALMLVLAFATSAMAAQVLADGSYLSTTATGLDDYTTNTSAYTTFSRTYQANKFTVDGYTYYPFEIYLPNELNPDQYRIHSNYTKNTDACASCHSTHTAVGNSLLQWYTVYETCMACHDGTLGLATYNVEEGQIVKTGQSTFGGMFGTGTEASLSNHNVTGSMAIAAAPGGSTLPHDVTINNKIKTRWDVEFGCQSCHSPHGQGGNARILHPDPNLAASDVAQAKGNTYYVKSDGLVYNEASYANRVYIIKGYPYDPKIYSANGTVIETAYKIDNKDGLSKIIRKSDGTVVTGINGLTVNGVASIRVEMTIGHYLGLDGINETVTHVYGMNFYCGACHTDYNTAAFTTENSASQETGIYAQAHRHQMGTEPRYNTKANLSAVGMALEEDTVNTSNTEGTIECLTCHVAHGVSQDYWAATLGGKAGADGTSWPLLATKGTEEYNKAYAELAGSSALKRMPNMGTCEQCHQKGENSEGYNVNAGVNPSKEPGISNGLMPKTFNYKATTADYTEANLGWVGSAKCLGCHEEYVNGWKETGHATSGHNAKAKNEADSCARCHNPGSLLMWDGVFNPTTGSGVDDAITCEACHGTGKYHVAAPNTKNIFNPGTQNIERQVIECGRCHDLYKNGNTATEAVQYGNLAVRSGSAILGGISTEEMAAASDWSVAFRVYDSNPAKFADASQKNTQSTHFGGAWGYADSKHFLGTSTDASNPNGVVSCNTCHDMHSEKHAGGLKFEYQQVCASCHDNSANLAFAVAMPNNSWARHQLETNDYAHSFKFGAPAPVVSATLTSINLENTTAYGVTPAIDAVNDKKGDKTLDLFQGTAGDRGGAIGFKLSVFDGPNGTGERLYNNYAGTYEIEYAPSDLGAAVEGVDYELTESGCVEFNNIAGTLAQGGTYDTGKLEGTYTVTWTSAINPEITATDSFQIKH